MRTLEKTSFNNQRALVRVDFNVPIDNGVITDNSRIVGASKTIKYILKEGGACILMSHLGRPSGIDKKYSLKKIVKEISKTLHVAVIFCDETIGKKAQKMALNLKPGQVLLLENLRFHKGETSGDKDFAKELSKLGTIYVNDAFGTAHRKHASTSTVAKFFGNKKCFGFLLEKEIASLNKIIKGGKPPVTAILGGSKVSSKISIIHNILPKINNLIIGGGMSFTFIKAKGGKIGKSICETKNITTANAIMKTAQEKRVQIYLPVDVRAGQKFTNNTKVKKFDIYNIDEDWEGMDAGPETEKIFHKVIMNSKTILWNGPIGVFEFKKFSSGTKAVGKSIMAATKKGAFSLVGGGDSVAAAKEFGFDKYVSYVSTGGGAMLESLEGKTLPGIQSIIE
tara:strand:- start:89 stop:1273 length:1185 start_codon:yes stop_codon:yes gene_type:complete